MPKIVVLDSFALNPGDLSWAKLELLGVCTIHERTPKDLIAQRAAGADILLTNKTPLDRNIILGQEALAYIGVMATGYNIVDVIAAREKSIPVTNVPVYGTSSVAQMVFAHLLNLTQHVTEHAEGVNVGKWARSVDWCYWDFPLCELEGMTMGIVGFGRIGKATARIAQAFGMQVLAANSSTPVSDPAVRNVELDTLFRESDVVTLHCPLNTETENLVNGERLDLMKPSAFLINTSRGPLIDETALCDALNEDRIAGAGLDVLCVEPPPADHPLYSAKNCYITPHIAWATHSARKRLLDTAVENVKAFLNGQPQNVVEIF